MALELADNGLVYDETGRRLTRQEIQERQETSKEEDPRPQV